METIFKSTQHGVNDSQLSKYFDGNIEGVKELKIADISIRPSGHGHYKIKAAFVVDGTELDVKTTTSNMELIDAWKDHMNDTFNDEPHHYYDDENDLVNSMLLAIRPEDDIRELVFLRD